MADFNRRKDDSKNLLNYSHKLENIIQLYEQLDRTYAKVVKSVGEKQRELNKEADRYLEKLDKLGAKANNKDYYIKEYERVKELLRLQEESVEFQKEMRMEQLRLSGATDEYIEQEQELMTIKSKYVDLQNDDNIALEKKIALGKELKKQEYEIGEARKNASKVERETERILNARKSAKEEFLGNGIGGIFGTNLNDIKSIRDGTFLWKKGTEIFSKAVETFKDAVKSSIQSNYESTENTLNRITASNDIGWDRGTISFNGRTYNGVSKLNNAINDRLWETGMFDNVSNTDIIEATAKLTSESGFGIDAALVNQTAQEKAYQDTIIKYLVPYLDTATESYEMLEMAIPGMSKTIAAINIATRENYGESQYLSKHSSKILEMLEPMYLNATKEQYYDEYQKLANILQGTLSGTGMNMKTINKVSDSATSVFSNLTHAARDGNLIEKETALRVFQSGDTSASNVMSTMLQVIEEKLQWANTGNALNDEIIRNELETQYGIYDAKSINVDKLHESNRQIQSFAGMSLDELDELFQSRQEKADDYNTNSDKLNKALLNATADIGQIKSVITDKVWNVASSIISGIVSGITGWIGLKIVEGHIGKMAESLVGNASGKGLMSAIGSESSSGTILGTLAPIAGTVAAIAGINAGVQDANEKTALRGEEAGAAALKGTQWENNNTINALSKSAFAAEDRNFMENGWNNMTGGIGFGWSMVFQGKGAQNKNLVQWIMSSDTFGSNPDSFMRNAAVLGIMMDQIGYFEDFKRGMEEAGMPYWKDANAQDLVDYLVSLNYKKKDIDNSAKSIIKAGWMPVMGNGKRLGNFSFDSSKYGLNGQEGFRQGLSKVPYDNYLASLHQGEAVLTASTANELRNLLDEYRSNTHIGANLDVIIQQQTVTLCNKLDEVVRAINMSNVGSISTASSEYQARAHNLLRTSMLTMKNTKDALN